MNSSLIPSALLSKNKKTRKYILVISILILVIANYAAYSDMLGLFFTGTDALTLIETNRIYSIDDFFKIFTKPMMSGTAFPQTYYRPFSSLTFSVDFFIWNLNPFGYHLTNLILHTLVTVLVYIFLLFLVNDGWGIPLLGSFVFGLHPIHIESVYAIGRRMDSIVAIFILLSLIFLLCKIRSDNLVRHHSLPSIMFYALALASKEIALIETVLVFSATLLFTNDESRFSRTLRAIKMSVPYVLITILFIIWHIFVLRGVNINMSLFGLIKLLYIPLTYFGDLIYPVDFLNTRFRALSNTPSIIDYGNGFLILGGLMSIWLLLGLGRSIHRHNAIIRVTDILLKTIGVVALICISFWPIIHYRLDEFIRFIFTQKKMGLVGQIVNLLEKGEPIEYLLFKYHYLAFVAVLLIAIFSALLILLSQNLQEARKIFPASRYGDCILFLLVWLFLPMAMYLITMTMPHRYISVIPFCAILSFTLSENTRNCLCSIRLNRGELGCIFKRNSTQSGVILICFLLLISFSICIHIIKTEKVWDDSSNIASIFFAELSSKVKEFPKHSTVYFFDLPVGFLSHLKRAPNVKVSYLADYSIKSWFDLSFPNNQIDVHVISKTWLPRFPNDLYLDVEVQQENVYIWIECP